MPWSVTFFEADNVVETRYEGSLTPDDLRDAVTETIRVSVAHQCRFLVGDCTTLEGGHSISDLYAMASLVEAAQAGPFKEAVILPQLTAPQHDVRFWETTCFNRGINVRVFGDHAAAWTWLRDSATD